jgi:hypothetical protein
MARLTLVPELKEFDCPDIVDLPSWKPDGDDVCYWLELSIGLPGSGAADLFQVCVATPSGLKSPLGRRVKPRGAARAKPIVLQSYSWAGVLDEIQRRLDSSSGAAWLEIQEKLGRHFLWEYENYK